MAETYRITGPQGYRSRLSVGEVPSKPISSRSRAAGKTPAFILDLDQTIWDVTDEAKSMEDDLIFRLKKEKGFLTSKDWTAWTKAAADVKPIPEMVDFVKGLQESGIKPVIMTARDEQNRAMIRSTLKEYGISTDHLMLRGLSQAQQDMPSDLLKVNMMKKMSGQFNFLAMLDDSASNLKGAYRFGVPLSIQPEKAGFDSLEASLIRGAKLSEVAGARGMIKAERTIEPIMRAGATGVMSPGTLKNIINSAETSIKIMRGIL